MASPTSKRRCPMYLDELIKFHKQGDPRGIPSICSAHPVVLSAAMQIPTDALLIEATCNQVNQFGGYTNRTPEDFIRFINEIAETNNFPRKNLILGGDHLGPSVWQGEAEASAMDKARELIRDYVKAGFKKIHLDCSMSLADDPVGPLDLNTSAQRSACLAKIAEEFGDGDLRYVIGTEVPLPGGATEHEDGVSVTRVSDLRQTIECTQDAFRKEGLDSAWKRVIAVVVQPGVEYGDDFVIPYDPDKAKDLSKFIESQPLVYEAHSTDYQTREALRSLVNDHFAILKVGPAVTFVLREAIFGLAMIESEILPSRDNSKIISVLDQVMIENPVYWKDYYKGSNEEIAQKRKFSLSDRIRYYWTNPFVQQALEKMIYSLANVTIPSELIQKYLPEIYQKVEQSKEEGLISPVQIMQVKIMKVLSDYYQACY